MSDTGITGFLQVLARVLPAGHAVLTPRTASLLGCLQADGRLQGMSGIKFQNAAFLHVIAEADNHWFLLSLNLYEGTATHWDPMPARADKAARALNTLLGELLGRPGLVFQHRCNADLGHRCCGAIALCHLLLATGLLTTGSADLVHWVQDRATAIATAPAMHVGAGGLTTEHRQALSELLVSKGVPEHKAGERIAEAIQKTGAAKIEEGMKASKPWAVLQAVASGLAQPFRWIKADELEQQIRLKADNKFGTAAAEARSKKKAAGKSFQPRATQQPDPRLLTLVEGSFVTEDGTAVPNLSMEDVEANAHGVT